MAEAVLAQNDTEQSAERIVRSVGIPPMPAVLQELQIECGRDIPDFNRIEALVTRDVGLAAALLKTINSPLFGLSRKATSIKQALQFIGLRRLTPLVRSLLLRSAFQGCDQISMERFWDFSGQMALATAFFARRLPGVDADEAHSFGLFRDCGIPVMMLRFPDYKRTLGSANADPLRVFTEVEQCTHGTDHATVGFLLAKGWGLPLSLCQAIRWHHDGSAMEGDSGLPPVTQHLIALSLCAERALQLKTGQSQTAEWEKLGTMVLEHLGVDESEFEEWCADLYQAMREEAEADA